MKQRTGVDAIREKGWWRTHQWLLVRRVSQLLVLGIFLIGPLSGYWLVKGNLASSRTLDVLPLSDPFIALQSLAAQHVPGKDVLQGALIVVLFYVLVGGRSYCAWVCPINMVTDAAHWLRRRLGLAPGAQTDRRFRFWLLGMTLPVSTLSGVIAWELVNPVTLLFRELVFGLGAGLLLIAAIFVFDAFVSRHGWCGRLCPVGAFYSLIGRASVIRISASGRSQCNDCMDCFAVCPEPQVIPPALKADAVSTGPIVTSSQCTNCGRCIDICSKNVFGFSVRFNNKPEAAQ